MSWILLREHGSIITTQRLKDALRGAMLDRIETCWELSGGSADYLYALDASVVGQPLHRKALEAGLVLGVINFEEEM